MKHADIQALRTQELSELVKKISDLKRQLETKQIERYHKNQKNSRERRIIKKDIAIIETIISEKELKNE